MTWPPDDDDNDDREGRGARGGAIDEER